MAGQGSRILRSLFVRMLLAALVAGGAAAWYASRLPDQYRARALLIMAPMPIGHEKAPMTQVDFYGEDPIPYPKYLRLGYMESLPMPDYKLILTSEAMAVRVRDKLRALYQARGLDAGGWTVSRVRAAMDVQVKIFKQTYQELEYQQVVELLLAGTEPEILAEAANYWAEESIKFANELRFAGRQGMLEFFNKQIADTEVLLDAERDAIAAIERETDPDVLAQRIARMEEAVTAAQIDAAAGATGPAADGPPEAARAEAVGAELRPRIAELRAQLAETRRALASHQHKAKCYENQLEELAVGQYAARVTSQDVTPEFKVASPALPPEEKTGPMRSLIIAAAAVLACLAMPVHYFAMFALRRYARQIEQDMAVRA